MSDIGRFFLVVHCNGTVGRMSEGIRCDRSSNGEHRHMRFWMLAAPVEVVDMSGVRQRAREIAEQFNQRLVYDATYGCSC